jgi:hypothetical protein
MDSSIPAELRSRLERAIRWRPESYDIWWNKPLVMFGDRAPSELNEWELEDAVRKVEEAAETAAYHRESAARDYTGASTDHT